MSTYDFNKYLKQILDFSNDNETYESFMVKYNKLESIVNSKIGPSGITTIFENDEYLNDFKYVLDLYDSAPIDFKYVDIIRYINDLLKIANIRNTDISSINNFNDVYDLYKSLLKKDETVLLNIYNESLRLVLLLYKRDLEKAYNLPWDVKKVLQDYVYNLSVDNFAFDDKLIEDVRKLIEEEKIILPYFNTRENYHKDITKEFVKYIEKQKGSSDYNDGGIPKM